MVELSNKPILIGISGGAASGKDVLCQKPCGKKAVILSLSSFYRNLTEEEQKFAKQGDFDFDHPKSFDFEYFTEVLTKIKRRERTLLHTYDCSAYSSTPNVLEIPEDVDVVIVEGILTFYQKNIRDMFNLKIFVESDADTRLSRKVLEDVTTKGRELDAILNNYFKYVKPAFEEFCLPTKKYADIILPRALDNTVGIDLITEHVIQIVSESPGAKSTTERYISRVRNPSESCLGSIRPH